MILLRFPTKPGTYDWLVYGKMRCVWDRERSRIVIPYVGSFAWHMRLLGSRVDHATFVVAVELLEVP